MAKHLTLQDGLSGRFGDVTVRRTGLPRRVLLGVGLVAVVALLAEHGFAIGQVAARWLHRLEALLALVYVADRAWLLQRWSDRWATMRERCFEFGVLAVFLLLGIGLGFSASGLASVLRFLERDHPLDVARDLVKLFLLANVLVQLLRLHQRLMFRGARPEWMLAASFAMLILGGTLLLLLPRASASAMAPIGLLDALFTATSAACVTGLSVRDTGSAFSPLGQFILLVLFQTGGIGIMTFVAFLAVTSAESLPVPHLLAFRQMVGARNPASLRRQVWAIVAFTALVEAAGAACLFAIHPGGTHPLARCGWSVFHSVSAFCNAGFALSSDSLTSYQSHPTAMLAFMALIVLGGLGFLVVVDLLGLQPSRLPLIRRVPFVARYNQRVPVYRLPVQTRLSVWMTVCLLLLGTVGFWSIEAAHALSGKPVSAQFWIAAFQSVAARTAGFNTVPIDQLHPATLLLLMALMVVGACPVSTGGGIKTVTLAVLLLALRALVAGRQRVELFGRALPQRVLLGALAVAVLYGVVAVCGVFGLTLCDPHLPFRSLLFETVSALSTVGLSTGITAQLSPGSQLILCGLMFVGRVGPISLVLSVVRLERPTRYQFPEEDLVVG